MLLFTTQNNFENNFEKYIFKRQPFKILGRMGKSKTTTTTKKNQTERNKLP